MTASLQVNKKDGKYYIHLNWKQGGKRMQKCIGTGLSAKGRNKRKAELAMQNVLMEWQSKIVEDKADMLFSDYMAVWMADVKNSIQKSTHSNYKTVVDGVLRPYFEAQGVSLMELSPRHIQDFYTMKMESGISPNTIHHYHSYINGALKHAVNMEMIRTNPASKVILPKKQKHRAIAYEGTVIGQLLEAAKGTKLEAPLRIAAVFGTRRGEILGVKWSDIDFDERQIEICHVIGKAEGEFYKDTPKNETSIRSFDLSDEDVKFFRKLKAEQKRNRLRYGERYSLEDKEFVCLDKYGHRLKLDYLSRAVPRLSQKLGLGRIKLHELRHSNISILIDSGASINDVKEWAGHSSTATTTDIYGHAFRKRKAKLAEAIHRSLCESSTSE